VLTETRDDYIRESTTRTRISESSGSRGGNVSSTHTGSSGRTMAVVAKILMCNKTDMH